MDIPLSSETDGGACGALDKGVPTVIVENEPVAIITTKCTHGKAEVSDGSSTVFVCNESVARLGDDTSCGGRITRAANRTFIGG